MKDKANEIIQKIVTLKNSDYPNDTKIIQFSYILEEFKDLIKGKVDNKVIENIDDVIEAIRVHFSFDFEIIEEIKKQYKPTDWKCEIENKQPTHQAFFDRLENKCYCENGIYYFPDKKNKRKGQNE